LPGFFLNKPSTLKQVDDKNIQGIVDLIVSSKTVVILPYDNNFLTALAEKLKDKPIPFVRLNTPFGQYGAFIFNPL
jgi:hypothetical protein